MPVSVTSRRAKKSLGQHFLVDRTALRRVVEAADLSDNDVVLEVGPGRGHLTRVLAERVARLVAVEIDEALAGALAGQFSGQSNVEVVAGRRQGGGYSVAGAGGRALQGGRQPSLLRRFAYHSSVPGVGPQACPVGGHGAARGGPGDGRTAGQDEAAFGGHAALRKAAHSGLRAASRLPASAQGHLGDRSR